MSKRTKGRVAALAGESTKNFYDLSLAVKKLHEQDPTAFAEIWKEKLLDRRTAYYLLDVGKLIEASELSKAEAQVIGWTKLQVVARHLLKAGPTEEEEFKKFIDLAKDKHLKVRDLSQALSDTPTTQKRAAVFHLNERERSRLNEALLAFGAKQVKSGLAEKERALMRLVRAALASKG